MPNGGGSNNSSSSSHSNWHPSRSRSRSRSSSHPSQAIEDARAQLAIAEAERAEAERAEAERYNIEAGSREHLRRQIAGQEARRAAVVAAASAVPKAGSPRPKTRVGPPDSR